MKGFRNIFNAGFTKGLRSSDTSKRNSGLFTECVNARVMEEGLEGYIPSITAFPAITGVTATMSWPFPQLLWDDTNMYVGNRTSLYQLVPTAGVWAGTKLTTAYTGVINWPWTFAKFPMFPVFASGDMLIYYDYAATAWKYWQKGTGTTAQGSKWSSDWYQPTSVCDFRGQAIAAGSRVATTAPSQSRIVRWSDIGAFDFLGKTSKSRKNEAGQWFLPYDDKEICMRVLPLENAVIVYGTFGVWAMIPVESPAATFGFKRLYEPGIVNPLAVGGDLKRHLFVDRFGELVSIDNSLTVTDLGYSEFFETLQDSISHATGVGVLRVLYDEINDEWHIGTGVKQYLFKNEALTEIKRAITSMVTLQRAQITDTARSTIVGGTYGFYQDIAETYMRFVTDTIDMGLGTIKMIETVEVQGDFPSYTALEVAIDYRYDKSSTFARSSWVRCAPDGVATPMVAGNDLRVAVRVTPYTNVKVYGLSIGWKLVDKRHIRGMYADIGDA